MHLASITAILSLLALTACHGADPTALPLGDGSTSTAPAAGAVWTCQSSFPSNAPGAQAAGPWIDEQAGTWDSTTKLAVRGAVDRGGEVTVSVAGDRTTIAGNGLPTTPTGVYPVRASDPAYAYDRNPNTITGHRLLASLDATPAAAARSSCVGGTVGVSVLGVPIFSAFDAGGRDAVAWEVQDSCDGHPERTGQYHFHSLSSCFTATGLGAGGLFGYALDGFGIYVETDARGESLVTADLDECHGRTSPVLWQGRMVEMYHYVATPDFPYTVGCFRGTPITSATGLAIGR